MGTPVKINAPLQRSGAYVFQVRWSPDSSRLLHISNDTGEGVYNAFVVALAAPGDESPINGPPDAFAVQWAPCTAP